MTINQQLQIVPSNTFNFRLAKRPLAYSDTQINKRTGEIAYIQPNGMFFHSALRKDEWDALDEIVVEAAGRGTAMMADVPKKSVEDIGVLATSYNTASQLTEADVSMSGRSRGQSDAVDFTRVTIPMPVTFKEVDFGERQLLSSRKIGEGIDTQSVYEATRAVVEKLAEMFYNGLPSVVFNGNNIYGLTNHPSRNTGTGADWGTYGNIHTNVVSMIAAVSADNYNGPWILDVANTQYNQMLATNVNTDTMAIDVVRAIPDLESVVKSDQLADGSAVLRQNTRNVVEWSQVNLGGTEVNGISIALVEWMSGDGMVNHLKVMAVGAPVIKSDYPGQSGIAHFTGL